MDLSKYPRCKKLLEEHQDWTIDQLHESVEKEFLKREEEKNDFSGIHS